MKNLSLLIKYSLLILLFVSNPLVSCQSEDLFNDIFAENSPENSPENDDEGGSDEGGGAEGKLPINTTPCDYTLETLTAGSTLEIECQLDLGGATINVPSDFTFVYKGGEIVNGTLNFGTGGKVDGDLLNSQLQVTGAVSLINEVFLFHTARWEIVEGNVNDDIAYNNKIVINEIMNTVKDLGATTIKVDALDAYFQTQPGFVLSKQTPQDSAIQVPSNTHLILSDNTHLRVQPNNFKNTVLITLFLADNSTLEGGTLHGDRDTHDYSDTSTRHEWGHLVLVKASKNAIVKGMTLIDAGGDGINVNSLGHTFSANYTPAEDILITNNVIIRARRNGMSITGGKNMIIENNEIIDTGVDTERSNGTAPRWAIDIEPVWGSGGTVKFETVDHVIIRNNIERGSDAGGFINARGSFITYEGNTMESTINIGQTTNSIVRNNIFKRNPNSSSLNVGIYAGNDRNYGHGNELNHSNEVYGNEITGFSKGIFMLDPEMDLHHNTMINCGSGIQILKSRDSKIRDNTIINELSNSEGIGNKTTYYANNVDIYNNTIKVMGSPFRFTDFNMADENIDFSITIRDNDVTSLTNDNSSFNMIRGFDFKNNVCNNSGIRTINASIADVSGNTFTNGIIRISQGCANLNFTDNIITGGRCFQDDNTDAVNIVKENNTCN